LNLAWFERNQQIVLQPVQPSTVLGANITATGNPMTICYLLKTFPKVSETFVLQEILALQGDGYDLVIASLQKPTDMRCHDEIKQLTAPVFYLQQGLWQSLKLLLEMVVENPKGVFKSAQLLRAHDSKLSERWRLLRQSLQLARWVKRKNITHIHAHFANDPASLAELVQALTGIGFSISAHAKDIYLSPPAQLRRKIAAARFVVTCTEYNCRYLCQINISPTPIIRVYHGFDRQRFQRLLANLPDADALSEPLILSVGRLREKKGFDTLIASCGILKRSGYRFRCDIVGYGPERETLQKQIDALGLGQTVWLRGSMVHEKLVHLYRHASIFALPCRVGADGDRDGIPNVLMEAMAMNIPVVTTPVSGIPELVEDGINGMLVAPDQPRQLADVLQCLLLNERLRRQLAAAAKARLHDEFSLLPNLAILKNLFDLVLAGRVVTHPHRHPLQGAYHAR